MRLAEWKSRKVDLEEIQVFVVNTSEIEHVFMFCKQHKALIPLKKSGSFIVTILTSQAEINLFLLAKVVSYESILFQLVVHKGKENSFDSSRFLGKEKFQAEFSGRLSSNPCTCVLYAY